jgi:hypothetical protein
MKYHIEFSEDMYEYEKLKLKAQITKFKNCHSKTSFESKLYIAIKISI